MLIMCELPIIPVTPLLPVKFSMLLRTLGDVAGEAKLSTVHAFEGLKACGWGIGFGGLNLGIPAIPGVLFDRESCESRFDGDFAPESAQAELFSHSGVSRLSGCVFSVGPPLSISLGARPSEDIAKACVNGVGLKDTDLLRAKGPTDGRGIIMLDSGKSLPFAPAVLKGLSLASVALKFSAELACAAVGSWLTRKSGVPCAPESWGTASLAELPASSLTLALRVALAAGRPAKGFVKKVALGVDVNL